MAEIIRMPEVLAGAAEAAIQTWLVGPGSAIEIGQSLAEIETDKAVVEFTAETAGIVGVLLVPENDSVAVGDPLLVLLAPGETEDAIVSALAAAGVASDADTAPALAPDEPRLADPAPQTEAPDVVLEAPRARLFASPLVRQLAAQAGVSLDQVAGTGPNGRIVRRDLEKHLGDATTSEGLTGPVEPDSDPVRDAPTAISVASVEFEDLPLSRMRKTIARRLTESKATVPHFYLVAECRVDALLDLRRTVNESASRKISVNDFVIKAVAGALDAVPEANSIWNGDSIRRFSSVDISVAVAIEGGLVTPVIRGAHRMSLSVISATVADLATRAREGRLRPEEFDGGSFTVSNLGMYGTREFTAILNPPQAGIIAVGAARPAPVVDAHGEIGVGQLMTVTLSADHRVVDGAVAATWLSTFQRLIENPLTLLI